MKSILLILMMATSAMAQHFGDDNPSGKWLPIPDGYEWPAEVDNPPGFKTVWKKFAKLPKPQREAIRSYWPEDLEPKRVSIAAIDLNADGKPELFLKIPAYGGTGGPFYAVFSQTDAKAKTYRGIGGIQGWGFLFLKRNNGWLQIEGMSRGGGGHYTRYLMAYTGERYSITRNEGHDYNKGKVTVRKTGGK